MKRFEGYAIYSDVDNTLLTPEWTIAPRNLEALEEFTAEGGLFALASGRGPAARTFTLFDMLPMINSPCILLNGALLYDAKERRGLSFQALPEAVKPWLVSLHRERPDWPISVLTADDRFQIGPDVEELTKCSDAKDVPLPWGKLLFHVPEAQRESTMEWLRAQSVPGVEVTACDKTLLEIVPMGISKGAALERVIEMKGLSREHVAAVGDYYNDMAMLSTPGIRTFCPANAAEEIQAVCEKTVCSVYDGALADVVEVFRGETGK